MQNQQYLTRTESAEYLSRLGYRTSPKTLAKYACVGGGPKYRKFGQRVLYSPSDLVDWAEAKTSGPVASTSELGAA
ncbi:hypothetical protein B27N_00944 [Alcanivorax marinus]|nr:hypothetical protein [Alloalcanivorax marinus]